VKSKRKVFNNYEKINGGDYFVCDDLGRWGIFGEEEFAKISSGEKDMYSPEISGPWTEIEKPYRYPLLAKENYCGPSLHIMVITLACNHACLYCRVSPEAGGDMTTNMTARTAIKAVDAILSTPNENITVEFQGGEALLNWPVLKEAATYAMRKNVTAGKNLLLSIVTNFSLMDEDKFNFITENGISVCTSLDGPAELHNKNRRYGKTGAHDKVVYWIKRFLKANPGGEADSLPYALMTTTKHSLGMPEEIVEEYRKTGLGGIFIRPLSPIGQAGKIWEEIGYTPEEYEKFYSACLDKVFEINRAGDRFIERACVLLAKKLLQHKDPNYLDSKTPCGAATGQLAYNWDGKIYTCDEGRMVGAMGDDLFLLGKIGESSYGDILTAPAARTCCMASCVESQPKCCRCAFKYFCGLCPVHNYAVQGTPWGDINGSYWCGIQKAVFRTVLSAIKDEKKRDIIDGWLDWE